MSVSGAPDSARLASPKRALCRAYFVCGEGRATSGDCMTQMDDVSSGLRAQSMFEASAFNQDISRWDTNLVEDMSVSEGGGPSRLICAKPRVDIYMMIGRMLSNAGHHS